MEVGAVEVKEYFEDLKKVVLDRQSYWEEIDPRPHAVGVLIRRKRLTWYEEILPKIEETIELLEDIKDKTDYIE